MDAGCGHAVGQLNGLWPPQVPVKRGISALGGQERTHQVNMEVPKSLVQHGEILERGPDVAHSL